MSARLVVQLGRTLPLCKDDLTHYYCCDENASLCGFDITNAHETEMDTDCVVCNELAELDCPRCGR